MRTSTTDHGADVPEWPAAPVWAETVSRTPFGNSDDDAERHYERAITVDGVTATIYETHDWGEDEDAGQIVGGGDVGIELSVQEFTPENAEACGRALLAVVAAYREAIEQG